MSQTEAGDPEIHWEFSLEGMMADEPAGTLEGKTASARTRKRL